MSAPFRVALSGDFRKPDGSPVYPDFDLEPLRKAPNVEFAYLGLRNLPLARQHLDAMVFPSRCNSLSSSRISMR